MHYFARVQRAQEHAETDEDLTDFDKLLCAIRGLMNTHFSIFSPLQSVRNEVMQEFVRSVSNLRMGIDQENNNSRTVDNQTQRSSKIAGEQVPSPSTSDREESDVGAVGLPESSSRRVLKSYGKAIGKDVGSISGALAAALYPFALQSNHAGGSRNEGSHDSNRSEKFVRKISLNKQSKSRPKPLAETSDSVAESDSHSSASSDPPVERYREKRHSRRTQTKSKPVSEWNIKYDGKDHGQSLMKFIKEVEFYAKSENVSKRELFRSAIICSGTRPNLGLCPAWKMKTSRTGMNS